MKYFDRVKDIIQDYSLDNVKSLVDCEKTIRLIKDEDEDVNAYIGVAKNFVKYEKGCEEEKDDWYFYKYLKSLGYDDKYIFPIKNGEKIEAKVCLFKPFDYRCDLISPQWHLLVSYYAYIDAAFNHAENKYAKEIINKNGWKCNKPIKREFNNKVLCQWMKEAKK